MHGQVASGSIKPGDQIRVLPSGRTTNVSRIVTRDGESLGDALVREGLAETWQGRRGSWC